MRLIAVVFGVEDDTIRNQEISKMLDYGFNVYETEKLLSNNRVIGKIEVIKGKAKYVNIVPLNDLNLLYKKGEQRKNVTYEVQINNYNAPLTKGEAIGEIKVLENNKEINKVEVTVEKDVAKANIIELYIRYLTDIIRGDMNIKTNKKLSM
jgi:D-alanyl-D-alanine carboxypeptidase (penicillin-binding protein 5/6)